MACEPPLFAKFVFLHARLQLSPLSTVQRESVPTVGSDPITKINRNRGETHWSYSSLLGLHAGQRIYDRPYARLA